MNANGRRARQAKQNYNHLAKRQRPNYKKRDIQTSVRHEARLRAKANLMQQRKGAKK